MLEDILDQSKPFKINEQTSEYLSIVKSPHSGKGEKHHILPVSIWPEYETCEWNLVNLSYKNHYRVHCLLPDMLEGEARASMLYAWNMMSGRHADCVDPAESYERFRIELNEIIREANTGRKWTDEQVETKRKAMMGEANHQYGKTGEQSVWCGKVGPNKGRDWSEETRKIWCNQRKGSGNSMYGRKHTEETKRKQSEQKLGDKHWQYGKTTTDAQKAAAALTCANRKWGADEREKVAEARRIPIFFEGLVYKSAKDAADILGLVKSTVSRWAKIGKATKLPKNWKELDEYKNLTEYTPNQ